MVGAYLTAALIFCCLNLSAVRQALSVLLLKNVFFSIGSANIPALFEIPIHRSTFFLKIFISPLKTTQK